MTGDSVVRLRAVMMRGEHSSPDGSPPASPAEGRRNREIRTAVEHSIIKETAREANPPITGAREQEPDNSVLAVAAVERLLASEDHALSGAGSKEKSLREALLLVDTIQKVATPTAANIAVLEGRPSVSGGHSRNSKPVIGEPPLTATLKHEIGLQKTDYSLSGHPPSRPQTNSIMHR